jgi:hypothetical protein
VLDHQECASFNGFHSAVLKKFISRDWLMIGTSGVVLVGPGWSICSIAVVAVVVLNLLHY